jgi:hypothetical protein
MWRRRVGVALAMVALAVTPACGGDDDSTGSGGAESSPSERSSPSGSPDGEAASQAAEDAAAFGAALVEAQREAGSARVSGTLGRGAKITGVMRFTEDDAAFDMTMSGAGLGRGEARAIVVDDVLYVQVPGAGRKFIELDPKDPDNPVAGQFTDIDPSRTFAVFEAVTDLERLGTERVDGVRTTKYAVTVDTEKSLEAQGEDPSQAGSLPDQVTYTVWVDRADLVRRIVVGPEVGGVDLTFGEWGEPVHISAPPASRIQQLPGSTGSG